MAEDTGIVQACMADLEDKIEAQSRLRGKVLHVYSEDELFDKTKQLSLPAIGIIYEGMRSNQQGGDSKTPVVSCSLVASIVVITNTESMLSAKRAETLKLIDTLRGMINRTRSPTGHYWIFQVEAPAEVKGGRVLWIQRWMTAAQV